MPLNDTKIRNAKPAEADYKLFDEKGLYLLVTKRGSRLWPAWAYNPSSLKPIPLSKLSALREEQPSSAL